MINQSTFFSKLKWPKLEIFCLLLVLSTQGARAFFDTPAELDSELQNATVGAIVDLGFSSLTQDLILNQGPGQLQVVPGNLIYSDDPETPTDFGILYRDALPAGNSRIYLYHVNGTPHNAKITAVLQNNTSTSATIEFTHKALPPPSSSYAIIGKEAVRQFYENSSLSASFTLAPGSAAVIDPELDATILAYDELVNAIYEFICDQPITVTILIIQATSDTLTTFASLTNFVANDGHYRQGTFPNYGKENAAYYVYNTADGIKRIRIADDIYLANDPFLIGTDAETGDTRKLKGNYGVTYSIWLNVTSSDGRRLAVLLNPRGGAYGGYVRTTLPTAVPVGELVPNPTTRVSYNWQGAVCAKFAAAASTETLLVEIIPAGASALPIELLLVPFSPAVSEVDDFLLYSRE
jgi:hypothetical protein